MSDTQKLSVEVREAIDQIEEAYEFMLAYAAQGRQQEAETEGASQIRGFLNRFRAALDIITAAIPQLLPIDKPGQAFAQRLTDDVEVMKSVLDLLTSRTSITSDMIDNTNGLIAVRSFLTDLFFVDQVILPARQG